MRKGEKEEREEGGTDTHKGVFNGQMHTSTTTLPDQCSEPEVARGKPRFFPSPSWQCQ